MKRALKHEIFEKRRALSKDDVKEKSLKIRENLFSLEEFKKAKNILFYVSFKNEVGTHKMIKELIAKKEKTVIVPYVMGDNPILQLSELKNFDWLEVKTFGVLEPKELYIREFNHEKVDLVIVPGIVFDKQGHRIGYGHGYYDKFLKKLGKNVKKIGLAFELQVVDEIPKEEHDVPVDCMVTEERVIGCNGK